MYRNVCVKYAREERKLQLLFFIKIAKEQLERFKKGILPGKDCTDFIRSQEEAIESLEVELKNLNAESEADITTE